MFRLPRRTTLFPYTTLFRSRWWGWDTTSTARPRAWAARSTIPAGAPSGPESRSDRKSTRLNSSHVAISYAVFCLKKKKDECFEDRRLKLSDKSRQHDVKRMI